ncbi:hypothetical protein QBC38DRAFT_462224 [Podospora fimiseda]|uniref:Uncharacterized protein n=1 Tax=Podospora fimiseda TaxID=252190 RepID=A0AAN6YLV2_9PEZI|nr:hypothetical protein QBC38DRAFT_462224 [Podospora fimiseda]
MPIADDPETRRSTQGFVIMLFGGPIHWKKSQQHSEKRCEQPSGADDADRQSE